MSTTYKKLIWLLLFVAVIGMACNLSAISQEAQDPSTVASTAAAQTVEVRLTEIGISNTLAPTATQVPPTATLEPTFTPTTVPTNTVVPTNTKVPTATSTPVPCNWAQFVKDMTVADGSMFVGGTKFTKIWRIKNIGSCTWTKDYEITFDGGDKMGGGTTSMPKKVKPGDTVDIAIKLQAPDAKDDYKGYWVIRDEDGDEFGIGSNANKPIWVSIEVIKGTNYAYNFANNFCSAKWKTDDNKLFCQGTAQGYTNYVQLTNDFTMEGNRDEDEPALVINVGNDQRLRGIYPSHTVQAGEHFVTRIGCMNNSKECRVKVQINYEVVGSSTSGSLGEWIEKWDGETTVIDVDLSSLAGEEVIFTLDISSRGSSNTNRMFFLVPSIRLP